MGETHNVMLVYGFCKSNGKTLQVKQKVYASQKTAQTQSLRFEKSTLGVKMYTLARYVKELNLSTVVLNVPCMK